MTSAIVSILLPGLVVLLGFAVLHTHGAATPQNRQMQEFCGLSSVSINRNRKFVLVADSSTWTQEDECSVTMTSLLDEKLYIAFSKYDVTDCGVTVNLHWGNKRGIKEFTCKKKPDLFKGYHHGNDSTLTINISGAANPKEKYNLVYEISSNSNNLPKYVPVSSLTTPPSRASLLSPMSRLPVVATVCSSVFSVFIATHS